MRGSLSLGRLLLAGLLTGSIAGCVASPASTAGSSLGPSLPPASPPTSSASPEAPGVSPASGAPVAAWLTEPLTDVRTGSTVHLSDFLGSIVLVEGMATWCPPCLDQQHQAQQALATLGQGRVVYISLDVDPREPAATLRAYAARTGFDWPFLVASPAFLRTWADHFGTLILDPPATPIVVVDRGGHGTLTEVGIKSAGRLVQLARALGA